MLESYIQQLHIKNFRCFTSETFDLDSPVVVIEGDNGSGKTTLLEALHYSCYLRSFRTHISRDLIMFNKDTFFVSTTFDNHVISIGLQGTKKHVKIDTRPITSYKELRDFYRVITVTEDDLELIKGTPEKRRSFLDSALFLHQPDLLITMKQFQKVLEQRNALLQAHTISQTEFALWTEKLFELSRIIQAYRIQFLDTLCSYVHELKLRYWSTHDFTLIYQAKEHIDQESFEAFYAKSQPLFLKEKQYKRSLFGAHLDDIDITWNQKKARLFSSRGQQKLIVLIIKIAQLNYLVATQGKSSLLLDDFMSDFDEITMEALMKTCLETKSQVIFASPLKWGPEATFLDKNGISSLKVSI